MARFRNFLIHRYSEVDAKYIMEIVNFHLKDVVEFIKQIKKYMEKKEEKQI